MGAVVTAAGVAAGTMSVAGPLLQVRHVRRSGSVAGMSDVSWLLNALTAATWLAYSLAAPDLLQVVVNALVLVCAAWLLAALHRDHRIPLAHVAVTTVVAGAGALASASHDVTAAVVAVCAATVVVCGHQALLAVRLVDLSGVTPLPWAAAAVAEMLWGFYGLGTHQPVLEIHAPFAAVLFALLSGTIAWRRRCVTAPATS